MAPKRQVSGLILRGNTWHLSRTIEGKRVRESTGTGDLEEAERFLAHRILEARDSRIHGVRPRRTWAQASQKYLSSTQKASLRGDHDQLSMVGNYLDSLWLDQVHQGALERFIEDRKRSGRKARTINAALQVVRRILRLAANEWIDEHGLTWLERAPKIKLLPETDKRDPYPLSMKEQEKLFGFLPVCLRDMATFKVNTGTRDQEVCGLRWEWETEVDGMDSVFWIPADHVKNRTTRLVVLNRSAREVVERRRRIHRELVFSHQGEQVVRMNGREWDRARNLAGLPMVRVHDLKHTFGRRLREAGVPFEDIQDLLGHKSHNITRHYCRPDLARLVESANKVCGDWNFGQVLPWGFAPTTTRLPWTTEERPCLIH